MSTSERDWYPPNTFSGSHYQLWIYSQSGYGGWRAYTEHRSQQKAQVWAERMQERYPLDDWSVRQALR
jgi:hypothetical protein